MKARRKPVGWLRRSSPTILICVSTIGVVATAVMAAKAAPKAKQLLEEAEAEKGEALTKLETVKVAGPVYIPTVVTGVLTITCMFSANTLSRKTQAALSSAYALLDQSFRRYQGKVKELFGEEAHKQVIGEILMEDAENVSITAQGGFCNSSLDFGVEDEVVRRFYDSFSGRAFNSTIEKVIQAEYHLNRNFCQRGDASVAEFYEFLGLPEMADAYKSIGWDCADELYWVDFDHSITRLDDGFEYCVIDFVFDPSPLPEYR